MMKKHILTILLLSYLSPLASHLSKAQNITDLAVMNDKSASAADLDDWTEGPAIADSVFLCPGRVKYDNHCLQIEGRDVFLLSGTFHYFRTPQPLWRDRLEKMRRMGFNCVETYVPWNSHEQQMPTSVDDFSKVDLRELDDFLTLTEELGFYAIVRPGPYICAEWSGGGFPQWLMRKRPAQTKHEVWLQSDDPVFMAWNEHWYKAVASVTERHQIHHRQPGTGGVILWQLENEFNRVKWIPSKCKRAYLEQLARISRSCGIEVPFITCWTDQARNVGDGPLNGVIDMVNSYPRWQIRKGFGRLINQQLKSQPGKPLISGELQGGWSSDLGTPLSWDMDGQTPAQTQNLTLYALQRGFCALNFYMLVGGTNFDDRAARNQTASYDFAAAIGEDGSINERAERLTALAEFIALHGTHTARARIENVAYETTDSLVELLVRLTATGDRYLFVRTEDPTRPHRGTLTMMLDGQQHTLDFSLEAFGSRVFYLPGKTLSVAGTRLDGNTGSWYPRQVKATGRPAPLRRLCTLPTQTFSAPLPTVWQQLPEGKTVDAMGHYDRHFIYYKVEGNLRKGGELVVPIVGKGMMNRTDADEVRVMTSGELLSATQKTDSTLVFTVPQGTRHLFMLYDTRGLHHHTNLAVERNWMIGPRYVWFNGEAMRLSFAATEKSMGAELSSERPNSQMPEFPSSPSLLTWVTSSFSLSQLSAYEGTHPLWLHVEQQGNGFVYVNGHCLGRCYDYGPQKDYYIPDCWLRTEGENHIAVSLMPDSGGTATARMELFCNPL